MNLHEELLWKKQLFIDMGYGQTARCLNRINKNLSRYKKGQKILNSDISKLTSSFENEFILFLKNESVQQLREHYLKVVQEILEKALNKSPNVGKMLSELIFFTYQGMCTSDTITALTNVLVDIEKQSKEADAYLSLFLFNLHIDGQFFPTLRTLYGLKMAGKGKDIDFVKIQKTPYRELKKELGKLLRQLFEVYDDIGRHLRNAIAHANFIYAQGKLSCWDIDPKTKAIIWKQEMRTDELRYLLVYFYSISNAFIDWYLIRDTIEKVNIFAKNKF